MRAVTLHAVFSVTAGARWSQIDIPRADSLPIGKRNTNTPILSKASRQRLNASEESFQEICVSILTLIRLRKFRAATSGLTDVPNSGMAIFAVRICSNTQANTFCVRDISRRYRLSIGFNSVRDALGGWRKLAFGPACEGGAARKKTAACRCKTSARRRNSVKEGLASPFSQFRRSDCDTPTRSLTSVRRRPD